MNNLFAKQFAAKWEESWNSHDINKIMGHYASDVMIISPDPKTALQLNINLL